VIARQRHSGRNDLLTDRGHPWEVDRSTPWQNGLEIVELTQLLVGRDDELRQVSRFIRDAASHGDVLALSGDPGVGKTALLEAGVQAALDLDATVLRAAGTEFESEISYSGLNQLLTPLVDSLGVLEGEHRVAVGVVLGLSDESAPQPLVLISAILDLLRHATTASPLFVVAEDVQWIDRASASVLGLLSRRLAGTKIGLLTACRTGWQSSFDDRGLPHLHVRELDESASHKLIADAFPSLAPRARRRVLAEANGNPLALLELPRGLSDSQLGGASELPRHLPLTGRLEELFQSRVLSLEPSTRRLMLLVALEGTGDLSQLQAVAGNDSLSVLQPAERAGLVRIDLQLGRVTFRHSLMGAAVVHSAPSVERRDAHRTLAANLADDPVRRAWHLAEATIGTDEEVALWLENGSHHVLQRGDAVQAIQMLVRAAQFSPRETDRSRRLAQAAYIGAIRTDEGYDPRRLLDEAQDTTRDRETSLFTAAAAGYLLLDSDVDVDVAYQLVMGAIRAHDQHDGVVDDAVLAALGVLQSIAWLGMRGDLWSPLHEFRQSLLNCPLELDLADVFWADPARDALANISRLDAAIADVDHHTGAIAILTLAGSASYVDRSLDLRVPLARVLRETRELAAPRELTIALTSNLPGAWTCGHWELLENWTREGLEVSALYGPRSQVWVFQYYSALLSAVRGDSNAVELKTGDIFRWSIPRKMGLAELAGHHAMGLSALSNRDYDEAFGHLTKVTSPGSVRPFAPHALWVTLDLVESAVQTDRLSEAQQHVDTCKKLKLSALSSRQCLLIGTAEALVSSGDDATRKYTETIENPGLSQWPFDLARAQLLFGEHLRRSRSTGDARVMLTSAFETFEALGAAAWAIRASGELRATGIRRTTRTRQTTAGDLTPQELEVASLAASGLTSKEIAQRLHMSPRTVEAHLYKAFPKLGVTSRAALRDALAERDRTDE
jgi:DNA-binding CsgD family transcriptional regulator